MTWNDEVRHWFSSGGVAAKWSRMYEGESDNPEEHFFRMRRDFAVQYVVANVPSPNRILDLGCGAGPVITELLSRGRICVGLDSSQDMLRYARANLANTGARTGVLLQGDSQALPFPDRAFDGIICLGVISYVDDYAQVLREIYRVLSPGGTALLSFRNRFNPILFDPARLLKLVAKRALGRRDQPESGIGRFLDYREVVRVATHAGFEVTGFRGIGFGPFKLRGHLLVGRRLSIRMSDALTTLLNRARAHSLAKWLCDVSLWILRKPSLAQGT